MAPTINQMPRWMVQWFYATAIICTIDATFVVFRPLTLPGGAWFNFFYPYKWYITVDQRYNDTTDSYSYTQSLMNYAEVILNIITLILHYRSSCHTKPLAFTVSVMTFWKTVLYIAMFFELAGGKNYRQGNSLVQEIFIVYLTNGAWILFPYLCMSSLWKAMVFGGKESAGDDGYTKIQMSHSVMSDVRQRKNLS